MQKVYLLELTEAGYKKYDMFDHCCTHKIIKAESIKDARAIAYSDAGSNNQFDIADAWISPELSTCRNINGCGNKNSVILTVDM